MRCICRLLAAAVALAGCQSEVQSPMARDTKEKQLFAVGSDEALRLEKFLSRYSTAQAAKFRQILGSGDSRLASTNPQAQAEIDAIYDALDRHQEQLEEVQVVAHRPGPREAALIAVFLKTVPPSHAAKYRRALFAANAEIRSSNPAVRRMLAAIYQAREDELQIKQERSGGDSK